MELGHLLFLHSLSQVEVKTEFHHCMSLVYVGGNLGAFLFLSPKKRRGREKEKHIIHKHRLGAALNPQAILLHSIPLVLWFAGLLHGP